MQYRLGVFEKRPLRKIFGRNEKILRKNTVKDFTICTYHRILLGWQMSGVGGTSALRGVEKCVKNLVGQPGGKRRDRSEDMNITGKTILNWILKTSGRTV
jgi:hypothetical protein